MCRPVSQQSLFLSGVCLSAAPIILWPLQRINRECPKIIVRIRKFSPSGRAENISPPGLWGVYQSWSNTARKFINERGRYSRPVYVPVTSMARFVAKYRGQAVHLQSLLPGFPAAATPAEHTVNAPGMDNGPTRCLPDGAMTPE